MIGLVGVLMPGLRRVASRLTRGYPGDTECIDAAVLAGFVEAALSSSGAATGLAANLLWAAFRAGREIWVQEVSVSINRATGELGSVAARPVVGDHVDLVLARAVRAGPSRRTKQSSSPPHGSSAFACMTWRSQARARRTTPCSGAAIVRKRDCVAYLYACDPDLSDFRRNRGLGECGHSGEQGCGQVARSTADTPAPALNPKGGEHAPGTAGLELSRVPVSSTNPRFTRRTPPRAQTPPES